MSLYDILTPKKRFNSRRSYFKIWIKNAKGHRSVEWFFGSHDEIPTGWKRVQEINQFSQ